MCYSYVIKGSIMEENNQKTLGERFIDAFNSIDYSLRIHYGLNRSMGFSDVIRKCVSLNYIVRKYEDDLIDYGRLRNAIVHQGNKDYLIAEPHQRIVEHIEKIDRLINTPPKAIDICRRDVLTTDASESMEDVIKLIASSNYSNIPVYKDGELIGIANGQKILNAFGQYLISGGKAQSFLKNAQIEDMMTKIKDSGYYEVCPANLTIEDALDKFHKNPKLLAILLTKDGSSSDQPLGIVTGADAIEMNKVLEQY